MTSIDITLSKKKLNKGDKGIPLFEMFKLKIQSLNIIYGFLTGTESNEWLKDAEDGRGNNNG